MPGYIALYIVLTALLGYPVWMAIVLGQRLAVLTEPQRRAALAVTPVRPAEFLGSKLENNYALADVGLRLVQVFSAAMLVGFALAARHDPRATFEFGEVALIWTAIPTYFSAQHATAKSMMLAAATVACKGPNAMNPVSAALKAILCSWASGLPVLAIFGLILTLRGGDGIATAVMSWVVVLAAIAAMVRLESVTQKYMGRFEEAYFVLDWEP